MLLPTLTVLDEAESASEGSLDPLGLYSIADNMGVRLVPGVRERQQRPRFLTAICVSAALCRHYPPDTLAADGVSEPWQVFEWYVVEGLVRSITDRARLRGLPGQDKATRAVLQDKVPLSARRYLKTPSVFGFHGVYRTLARSMELERGGDLGEHGFEVLEMWERERELEGFYTSRSGRGSSWRDKLKWAIDDGLKKGATDRSGTWDGWDFIAKHLAHDAGGPQEKALLAQLLQRGDTGYRREVLEFLVSDRGRQVLSADVSADERIFHEALSQSAGPALRELLRGIQAYEAFARHLQDAFDSCLYALSQPVKRLTFMELAKLEPVVEASVAVPELFRRAEDALAPLELAGRMAVFSDLARTMSAADWVSALLEHHSRTQKAKPPNGKTPWIIRYDDGGHQVRPAYRKDEFQSWAGRYVHQYRTQPLTSFAKDLEMVP